MVANCDRSAERLVDVKAALRRIGDGDFCQKLGAAYSSAPRQLHRLAYVELCDAQHGERLARLIFMGRHGRNWCRKRKEKLQGITALDSGR